MSSRKKAKQAKAGNKAIKQIEPQQTSHTSSLQLFRVPVPYWQVAIAALGLLLAIVGSPWLIRYYNTTQETANIYYQLIVQPKIILGNDGKARDDTWSAKIMVINNGPATAKDFVIHLKLTPNLFDYFHSQPQAVFTPPGTDVIVVYAGGGSTYQISVKNFTPQTSLTISTDFEVSNKVKNEVQQQWETKMFSKEFVGRFIKYLWTSGENVKATIGGAVSPTPVTEWDVP